MTATILDYLKIAVKQAASDLLIVAGEAILLKKASGTTTLTPQRLTPDETAMLVKQIYEYSNRSMDKYKQTGDDDFSFSVSDLSRFRVSAYRQRGSCAAVVRVVNFGIPNWKDLNILEEIMDVSKMSKGLVLVTGAPSSGKSTTVTCIIDAINKMRRTHIITIENPIEHLHHNDKSTVSQRELFLDTTDYLTALRASLRQAPDVIYLNEMGTTEIMQTAMTAAETGHLVLSSMNTVGALSTLRDIISSFPESQRAQACVKLANVLSVIVSQQLLPTIDGKLMPAFEIMHVSSAVRELLHDGSLYDIGAIIQTGGADYMLSMDNYIVDLYSKGYITASVARQYAIDSNYMKEQLRIK